ncbi:GyrI-like domain-containing protein [Clostridium lacusfryxellense]|uniref:GyrI-like domain-containing protein n=1 Tax=Clostridium lacusfryxellense TaxID=205328 RepID=UPI001C0B8111|nr:GyrI-like domain-containing protein [Clostridium lacusfryxellense]MBU3109948.1 GyrI-like domain-containing protein [Clostridium lacusfryxellense]
MAKLEYKKAYKDLYVPKKTPSIIRVPSINFVIINGTGDPNNDQFALATSALYSFSYAVKMSYKSDNIPNDYYDYTVFPLEGVWDLVDKTLPSTDKSNFKYKIMIRQPDFLTIDLFKQFISQTKNKKPNIYLDKIEYTTIAEGLCCQMLHLGSYATEPTSFEMMDQFCNNNGYKRISLKHREIYLSDPRRIEPLKLKTVLRYKVEIEV